MSRAAPAVVFVDTELSRVFGGAQVFLGRLLPGLRSEGWQVSLVTEGRPLPPLVDELRAAGVEVAATLWRQPSTVAGGGRRLATWVNARAPGAYVLSASSGIGWAALPRLAPAVATVAMAHSDSEHFYGPLSHYRQFLSSAVAVSGPIEQEMRARLATIPVTRVPYGVPVAGQPPPKPHDGEAIVEVVFVGRFSQPNKRFHDVVDIAARLAGPTTHFTLLGDGEERGFAETTLAGHLAAGHVALPGWRDQAGVRRHLEAADIIVFTSPPGSEGLPLALLEAMGQAVFPVTSDISAFRQAVPGHAVGRFCPVGDVDAFVKAIAEVRDSPTERRAGQLEAWRLAQDFSVDAMVHAYDRLLHQVTASPSGRRRVSGGRHPLMDSCRPRYPPPLPQLKAAVLQRLPAHRSEPGLVHREVAPRAHAATTRGLGLASRLPLAWPVLGIPRYPPVDAVTWAARRRLRIDPVQEPIDALVIGDEPGRLVIRNPGRTVPATARGSFDIERAQAFAGLRVARVPGAHVHGHVVVTSDGYVLRDSLARLAEAAVWVPRSRRRSAPTLRGAHFLLGGPWADGYCHWVLDILPRLRGWELLGGALPLLVPGPEISPWQRDSLVAMGVDPSDLVRCPRDCQVESLFVPTAPGTPGAVDPVAVGWLLDRLGDGMAAGATVTDRRLYVSRSRARRRRLVNEAQVVAALGRLGFDVVHAEDLTFADQMATFSGAQVVVGLHGAGLTNTVFARPGAAVVEIVNPEYQQGTYYQLADAVGLSYVAVAGRPATGGSDPARADVSVDPLVLVAELRAMGL